MKFIFLSLGIILSIPQMLSGQNIEYERTAISSSTKHSTLNELSLNWTLGQTISSFSSENSTDLSIGFFIGEGLALTNVNTLSKRIDYKVFPNPTSDLINIEIKDENYKTYRLSVFDVTGKVILQKQIDHVETIQLNLSNYPTGLYLLEIRDASNNKPLLINKIQKT